MAYGTVNADIIQSSVSGVSLGAGNASIMKNRIINGAMVIDQRNAGASVTNTASDTYTLDRWKYYADQSSKFTVQQNAGSVTPPAGFKNYLGITSLSSYSVPAGELYLLRQVIEGYNMADLAWGTADAKTVTFSFWVRSSLTGTFGGTVANNSQNYTYPFSYTISAANTWEQKTITITGATSGTWLSTNGNGITVAFGLGVGSSLSGTAGAWVASSVYGVTGATSVVGTSGATFYITGVQLEVGSSATGFEYRQYGQEFALCQRYYTKFIAGTAQTSFILGVCNSTTNAIGSAPLPVSMRSSPTVNYSTLRAYDGVASNAVTAVAVNNSSQTNISAEFTTSGMTAGRTAIIGALSSSSAYLDASAEL